MPNLDLSFCEIALSIRPATTNSVESTKSQNLTKLKPEPGPIAYLRL